MEVYINVFIKIILCVLVVGVVADISILLRKTANKISKTVDELKTEKIIYQRRMNTDASYKNEMNMIVYSKDLLSFTKEFISEIVLLKYTEFEDARDMDKITEINIKNLIQEIASIARKSLDVEKIQFDYLIFTKEYYEQYIVYVTIQLVKKLLNSI